MHLLTLGLNHQTASIDIRERASFGPDSVQQALTELVQSGGIREAAILSTCNRTEVYCGQESAGHDHLVTWLARHSGLDSARLSGIVYRHPNEEAVRHAFRVASGLDSMVLGEPQILGQMKDAFHTALRIGTTGKVLNNLFQRAFNVAKQVRTDTAIGKNAVSVAYTGVSLAKRIFTRLSDQNVLLIGAGETIELVARHLRQNQVRHILIANRSIERAQVLADEVNSEAITLSQIPDRLPEADIVVTSTASPLPILGKGAFEAALKKRRHRPMFILDLAVPRDVEPEVGQLRDAYLYTVDDLRSLVEENRVLRRQAAAEAENIIDLQVVKFMRWMRALDSVSIIRTYREGLDALKRHEMEKALRQLERGEDPGTVLEKFASDLANKIAHRPTQVLRQAETEGNSELIASARKLLDL